MNKDFCLPAQRLDMMVATLKAIKWYPDKDQRVIIHMPRIGEADVENILVQRNGVRPIPFTYLPGTYSLN